jgi:hypothetical protein
MSALAPYADNGATGAISRTLYRRRLQFLCERPDRLFRFCPQGIRRAIERHNKATLARPVRRSSHRATGFNAASLRISAVKKRHQTGKRLALGGECGAA